MPPSRACCAPFPVISIQNKQAISLALLSTPPRLPISRLSFCFSPSLTPPSLSPPIRGTATSWEAGKEGKREEGKRGKDGRRKEKGEGGKEREEEKIKREEKGENPTDLLLVRPNINIPVSQTWTND